MTWIPIQTVEFECPFCHKKGITAQYFPPSKQAKTSRTSAKSVTKIIKVPERYEGITGCKYCGKSDPEVKRAMKNGKSDPEKDKKILKRLKEQGLDFSNVTTKF